MWTIECGEERDEDKKRGKTKSESVKKEEWEAWTLSWWGRGSDIENF